MTAAPTRLSLCMIVRDSARTLPACLDSIRPWVDEMIVVDTGSLDDTREIARGRGAQVFEFPWIDDFSAARNESLRHAQGAWVFWMDSDDTIDEVNGRGLKALADGPHAPNTLGYVVQVHCPADESEEGDATVVDHVKLIRNDPRIRFEGRIHEQVLPSVRQLGGEVGWTDLFVVHSGADQSPEGKRRKYERDLRILAFDLAERPDHPFVLFNLGMTYEDMGEYSAAERLLCLCLMRSDPGESHVRKAYALLASCLERLGRFDEAREACSRGLRLFENDEELLFRLGLLEHRAGNLPAAVAAYRRVLYCNSPRHFTSIDRGITGHKARHNLALVHADRGEHASAELQWRRVLDAQPRFTPAWRGLGQSLLSQGKLTTLDVLIDELGERPNAQADRSWLTGLAAEQRGQSDQVRPSLEHALVVDGNHIHARQDHCRWLFHHGTLDEAESALRELVERSLENGAPLHNLGIVLSRQGKIEEAVAVLEQSLQSRPDSATTRYALHRLQELVAYYPVLPDHDNTVTLFRKGNEQPESFAGQGVLPFCYARRAIPDNPSHYHCLHPRVSVRDQVVTSAICSICTRWEDARPEKLRPESDLVPPNRGLLCRFIGPETGLRPCPSCCGAVNLKVFGCRHSNHMETTLVECRSCRDFLERVTASEIDGV